jgi:hypothetical protein
LTVKVATTTTGMRSSLRGSGGMEITLLIPDFRPLARPPRPNTAGVGLFGAADAVG